MAVFAKGRYYGKAFCAPYANIADGQMDICLIGKISLLRLLSLIGV